MRVFGIIPARYASTRFPGKPLADIFGKSMIRRVYEQAKKAEFIEDVVVATDDERIFNHVNEFGNVVYTSAKHESGTERCNEAARNLIQKYSLSVNDVIINIQGDEPFIDPVQIDKLSKVFDNPEINIATLAKKISSNNELFDENVVKVVFDKNFKALYFSRAAIPHRRNFHPEKWMDKFVFYKHIGIYAYRINALNEISNINKSNLEECESLEQLRWIENGYSVYVVETQSDSYSIDTPNDIKKIPPDMISFQ